MRRRAPSARSSRRPHPLPPPPPPPAPAAAPALLAPLPPADKINVIIADTAPPTREVQTARAILQGIALGKNFSELPKVLDVFFAQRLAAAASKWTGRT